MHHSDFMEIREWGKTQDNMPARLYILNNGTIKCSVTDYGASLVELVVPDKNGKPTDIVLGYSDIKGYIDDDASIGCNVGRCANRICGAAFLLNGTTYSLDKNDGNNNLHSGFDRYSNRLWKVEKSDDLSVTFSLNSPHLDQGFPGNVTIYITYCLTDANELRISYKGTPDADTIINITNHSYFNLNGEGTDDILNHVATINADYFTVADKYSIPTGEIAPVKGTPMDFSSPKTLGRDINSDFMPIIYGNGYDHNYCINDYDGMIKKAVTVSSKLSGISMDIFTDYPGVQLYTSNFLDNVRGKCGHIYNVRSAVCFEPQFYPDAIHHDNFVSPVCRAGKLFSRNIIYKFS